MHYRRTDRPSYGDARAHLKTRLYTQHQLLLVSQINGYGRTDRWMEGLMDRQADRWIEGQVDKWKDGQTDGQKGRQIHGQMGRQTDYGWTDEWTD